MIKRRDEEFEFELRATKTKGEAKPDQVTIAEFPEINLEKSRRIPFSCPNSIYTRPDSSCQLRSVELFFHDRSKRKPISRPVEQ